HLPCTFCTDKPLSAPAHRARSPTDLPLRGRRRADLEERGISTSLPDRKSVPGMERRRRGEVSRRDWGFFRLWYPFCTEKPLSGPAPRQKKGSLLFERDAQADFFRADRGLRDGEGGYG